MANFGSKSKHFWKLSTSSLLSFSNMLIASFWCACCQDHALLHISWSHLTTWHSCTSNDLGCHKSCKFLSCLMHFDLFFLICWILTWWTSLMLYLHYKKSRISLSRFLIKKGPILHIYQLDQLAILEKLIWTHSHWLLINLLMCLSWRMIFYQWLYIGQLNHLINLIINSCGHVSTSYTILGHVFLPCVNIWLVHYL